MTDISSMTTERLISDLDLDSYYWGLCHGTADTEAAERYRRDALAARTELLRRIDEKKRALDTGLSRGRELRETVSDLRVALQHEQNQRTAAEARTERAEARAEELEEVLDRRHAERDDLRAENERLTEERDTARTAALRVIRPEEVRKGQTVAYTKYHLPDQWVVRKFSHDQPFYALYDGTIVLLRDAPEDKDEERPACGCDCGCGAAP